jgi:replicative DNA helicase
MMGNFDYPLASPQVPPYSIQAEQSVLGGLMLDNSAWDLVSSHVTEADFYRLDHRLIFKAISRLADKQIPFDVVTLSDLLEASGELERCGGLSYLGVMAKDTPSAANIVSYANIVREKSVLRQLISVGTGIADSAFNADGRDAADLLQEAESQVFRIAEQRERGQGGALGMRPLLARMIDKIEERFENGGTIIGTATGFFDFDELTSGLSPGNLIIVAGRPSMGKTAFSMNIAEHVALTGDKPVAVFSMEMPADDLMMRMTSSVGRVGLQKIRTGRLEDHEWPLLSNAVERLNTAKLLIDDSAALTVGELRSRARRLVREHGPLGLVVVDYLQLMQSPASGDNRVQQISDISRGLKALAKELDAPVIALSQLNRNLEQRPNKRPLMSDLRESGAIEQDADLIVFVYRDEVYNKDSPDKGVAELIVGKQRNGGLGTVRLTFLGQFTRFENFMRPVYDDE